MSVLKMCRSVLALFLAAVLVSTNNAALQSSVDIATQNLTPNQPRQFSEVQSTDTVAPAAKGLLTLGLLGTTMALIKHGLARSSPQQVIQRRDGVHTRHDPYRRGHNDNRFYKDYAQNVRQFEDKVLGGLARAALDTGRTIKKRFRAGSNRVVNRLSHGAKSTARAIANGTGKLALRTADTARTLGRATRHGINRVGRVARIGAAGVGRAAARVSNRVGASTERLKYTLRRAGKHAVRSMRKSAKAARWHVGRQLSKVGRATSHGISRIENAARRKLYELANAYRRRTGRGGGGKERPPYRIYNAVYDSVSRIGELASTSAANFGGLATDGVDRIAEVARVIPESLATVAKEKKIQDCLLQTMCYISTPYLDENDVKRRKRALDEFANRVDDDGDTRRDLKSSRLLDDCEVFDCRVASLGRQAYDGWHTNKK